MCSCSSFVRKNLRNIISTSLIDLDIGAHNINWSPTLSIQILHDLGQLFKILRTLDVSFVFHDDNA